MARGVNKRRRTSTKKKNYNRYNARKMRAGYNRTGGLYRLGRRSGTEYKFFDTFVAPDAIGSEGEILQSFNLIPQTTAANGRIGREVMVRSIDVTLTMEAAAASTIDNLIRVVLYLDKQSNGAAAEVAQILNLSNDIPPLVAHPNLENSQRFVILKDSLFVVPVRAAQRTRGTTVDDVVTTNNTANIQGSTIRRMKKRLSLPITFSDGAVSMTSVKTNNLGLLLVSTDGGVEATTVGISGRIRYSDK